MPPPKYVCTCIIENKPTRVKTVIAKCQKHRHVHNQLEERRFGQKIDEDQE